ncbi:uncharacterized protein LOC111993128 isoform X1 [Quercus suber]|uniref:Ribonuclease h2 subunit c n=1 Tax=Quercus suber TaxID=58331 RepID=A0AAW0L294_QUESU|nr:ribonuclease H2 subunit C [Quercus suber]POE75273.1 ribonuclease h2 subunit c [Quercus suber]
MEMETQTEINLSVKEEEEEGLKIEDLSGKVHQLPCSVKYNGPSSVSQYFKPKPTPTTGIQESFFRGRNLLGTTLPIPHPYSGFVIGKKSFVKRKASDMSEEKNSSCWEVKAKFQNLTYWNHDTLPSHDDAFSRSFHWLSVAEALHKPVTAEDLVSASMALKKMD